MFDRAANITLGLALLLAPLAGWGQPKGWHYNSGNLLRAVKFIGQEGWVVGSLGHIMHTSDGGENWELQVSGTSNDLLSVSFIDNQRGWIGGTSATFLKTTDGGRNWIPQAAPSGRNIKALFIDDRHGWITVSVDSIFRTTDGGFAWEVHAGGLGFGGWDGIAFVDSMNGWTLGGGIILKSTDGGIGWTRAATLTDAATSISMVDSLYGAAVQAPGRAWYTRNGWRTWVEQPINIGGWIYGVSFQDSVKGCLCGGDNGVPATVYWTTNGGSTWFWDSSLVRGTNALYGIGGRSQPNWALAVGAAGAIVKSTNAGSTWRVVSNVDIGNTSLLNVEFYNTNNGWATGTYGIITHTTNGGTVWQRQNTETLDFLYGVDFPDSQRGWVCGTGGKILTTSNAGAVWTQQTSNTSMPLLSIDFPDTNALVGVAVGGYYGPLDNDISDFGFRISDWKTNGEMLNQVQYDEVRGLRNDSPWIQDTIKPWGTGQDFWKWPWNPQISQNPQTAYRTIIRTTNGGALWIAQNTSGQVPLYGVSFVTPREGWACGDPQGGMGVILHTTDSGATWTGQLSNVNQGLYWIQFRDRLHGWTVGNAGTALWTTDGGTTWNQGNTGTTLQFLSCAFYDTLGGFACGGNGTLFKTTDGGRNWQSDTSKTNANLMAVFALDSLHGWTVGSYGMVLGWRLAGMSGVETRGQGDKETRRQGITLEQSYPNPMRENCAIGYWLTTEGKAELNIYNITGRRVRSFASLRMKDPGRHTVIWDGKDEGGQKVAAGVYFYQLRLKELTETKKLVKIQ